MGGGAYAFGKIFQPFARKDRPTLLRVKPQMPDKIFFQRVTVFTFILLHVFFTYVQAEFRQSSASAGFSRFWLCNFP